MPKKAKDQTLKHLQYINNYIYYDYALSSKPTVPTAITTSMQWTPHTHPQPLTGCYITASANMNGEQRTGEGDKGQCKGLRCTSSCDDGWLWNLGKGTINDFIIISTVILIHELIWLFLTSLLIDSSWDDLVKFYTLTHLCLDFRILTQNQAKKGSKSM